jgi:hypothetical protein
MQDIKYMPKNFATLVLLPLQQSFIKNKHWTLTITNNKLKQTYNYVFDKQIKNNHN